MLASKMSVLKPLIKSKEGQHLTAYLANDQNIFHLRRQLRETLETAYEYLAPVMKSDALARFVAPIHNAMDDTKLLKNLKGNVGLFRTEISFRVHGINIFGKIDKKSGELSLHPADLDHEDDDILDDLAQEVLAQGGEVVVASREEIPKGRPILTILDQPEPELSKLYTIDSSQIQRTSAFMSMRHIMEALVEENQFIVNQLLTYITGAITIEENQPRKGLVRQQNISLDNILLY